MLSAIMLIFIVLIFLSNSALSQQKLVDKSKYDRLVIVDEYNNNYSIIYGRIYKVNLHDSLPELRIAKEYKTPDSLHGFYKNRISNWDKIENRDLDTFAGIIHPSKIDRLIDIINNPKRLSALLPYLGIDSLWHSRNRERLIQTWLSSNENSDKLDREYSRYILNNFSEFKQMAYHHVLQTNSSGYSNVVIAFENKQDTLIISSTGQESFRIPWQADSTYKNFDPELSALISDILPNDIIINKRVLSPTLAEFENGILMELTFKSHFYNRKKFKKYLREASRNSKR